MVVEDIEKFALFGGFWESAYEEFCYLSIDWFVHFFFGICLMFFYIFFWVDKGFWI